MSRGYRWGGFRGCGEPQRPSKSTTSGASASHGGEATPTMSRSPTTIEGSSMTEKRLSPVHPGEVLLEEFLKPMGLSQNRLGLSIGVHPRRINEIVLCKRRVTAETALRLARYFDTSPQFWLGLQSCLLYTSDAADEEDSVDLGGRRI